jgi:hypothetical protein
MLRTVVPLAPLLLFAPSLATPLAAAESSFDCRTARTARELATCADARIAAADRELAAAWQNAIAPLDPATVKALREPIRRNSSKISTAASRARSGASRVRRREKSCARRSRACAAAAVRGWYSRPPRQLRS